MRRTEKRPTREQAKEAKRLRLEMRQKKKEESELSNQQNLSQNKTKGDPGSDNTPKINSSNVSNASISKKEETNNQLTLKSDDPSILGYYQNKNITSLKEKYASFPSIINNEFEIKDVRSKIIGNQKGEKPPSPLIPRIRTKISQSATLDDLTQGIGPPEPPIVIDPTQTPQPQPQPVPAPGPEPGPGLPTTVPTIPSEIEPKKPQDQPGVTILKQPQIVQSTLTSREEKIHNLMYSIISAIKSDLKLFVILVLGAVTDKPISSYWLGDDTFKEAAINEIRNPASGIGVHSISDNPASGEVTLTPYTITGTESIGSNIGGLTSAVGAANTRQRQEELRRKRGENILIPIMQQRGLTPADIRAYQMIFGNDLSGLAGISDSEIDSIMNMTVSDALLMVFLSTQMISSVNFALNDVASSLGLSSIKLYSMIRTDAYRANFAKLVITYLRKNRNLDGYATAKHKLDNVQEERCYLKRWFKKHVDQLSKTYQMRDIQGFQRPTRHQSMFDALYNL